LTAAIAAVLVPHQRGAVSRGAARRQCSFPPQCSCTEMAHFPQVQAP
jgi:hypothetical protein